MLACLWLLVCYSASGDLQHDPLIPEKTVPVISIIIDDLGYDLDAGKQALALSPSVTASILPGRPHTRSLAEFAAESGNEVMVHLPMQSVHAHKSLGFGGLTENLVEQEFDRRIDQALNAVPYARGVNNHMGSLLTRRQTQMSWLMEALTERYQHYYFVDSKTSNQSIAERIAHHHYIPTTGRDIFLDHMRDSAHIERQFNRLIKIAKRRGHAVAIGHPHEETLAVLARRLPSLSGNGVRLVPVSELIHFVETPAWYVSSFH